ncbi:MAG: PQQ-dependent sugar dehydrogenase [Bacteroidota bacterium]
MGNRTRWKHQPGRPRHRCPTTTVSIDEIKSRAEGEVLVMVLHPHFSANPYVYIAYDYKNEGDYKEKIVRHSFNGSELANPLTLIGNINASGIHNGCHLLIKPDLKLFNTTGDASNQSDPRNNAALNGKILRLNLDQ